MKNNRSPGTSGFGADFYKVFWNNIRSFVVRALNEAFLTNNLSCTQTQGLITCIPKGAKPRMFLKKLATNNFIKYDLQNRNWLYRQQDKISSP